MAGRSRIVINRASNRQKYATLKSANNKVLAVTETYKTNQGVDNAVKALKKVVKNAVVIDKTKKR
jgi:uncharacterized protein YegP (UPF0339 family)